MKQSAPNARVVRLVSPTRDVKHKLSVSVDRQTDRVLVAVRIGKPEPQLALAKALAGADFREVEWLLDRSVMVPNWVG